MGRIADRVALMRGRSLAEIVAEIEAMEAEDMEVGPTDFAEFWKAWPHKVGKPVAERAYRAARKRKHTHQAIMDGLAGYIDTKPEDRPWLNPSTFLNQDRFMDAPAPVRHKPQSMSDMFGSIAEGMTNGQGTSGRVQPHAGGTILSLPRHRQG